VGIREVKAEVEAKYIKEAAAN